MKLQYIIILSFIPFIKSFGSSIHFLIGNVTEYHLRSDGIEIKKELLSPYDNLGNASVYADKIKFKYPYTRRLHYYNSNSELDDPPYNCEFVYNKSSNNDNIISGISNLTRYIDHPFEFKLLIHLLQDLHQPLHLTGKYKGGNGITICFLHVTSSLHGIWDTVLFSKQYKDLSINQISEIFYQKTQSTICKTKFDLKQLLQLSEDIYNSNCKQVWNYTDLDYYEKSRLLLEKLIIKGIQTSVCILKSYANLIST